MAELTTTAETTTNSCCAPEAQAMCCEPSAKADCCDPGHGEGCGCSAGVTRLSYRPQKSVSNPQIATLLEE
jgi:arsenite methyltransferase